MAAKIDGDERPQCNKFSQGIEVFANLKNAQTFALDIGLSLTKIAYCSTVSYRQLLYEDAEDPPNSEEPTSMVFDSNRLHIVKFETKHIEKCLDLVKKNLVDVERFRGKSIKVTGGGALKYTPLLQEKLGLLVDKEDEIGCLIKGCNFLLKNIPFEAFEYHRHMTPEYEFQKVGPNIFPYLLVNVGSGVSILKVESDDVFKRVGGTATGGGTFWGLGSLLTKRKDFDELLQLAEEGDHRNVDMLVKDIYGGDCSSQGLPGELIASAFGKAMTSRQSKFSDADLARSLLFTISNDIGHIASLYATVYNVNKVYFGGYFLRNHPLSMHTISYSIKYWSHDKVTPLFLRHEGYLGAIGAYLYGTEQIDKCSWLESYAGSSNFKDSVSTDLGIKVDQLEINQVEYAVTFCPLLKDPATYNPDTTDLTQDKAANQPHNPTAKDRGIKLKEQYINKLQYLREQPSAYGPLTVRILLDMVGYYMKEFDFPDPYLPQKRKENEEALKHLHDRITALDKFEGADKITALILGVLGGNMFDWGAKDIAVLLENDNLDFERAQEKIPGRPWLQDNLDEWVHRLQNGPPHNCAAIFVDNSGADIILGIIPFARDLLQRGTKVILCANSKPALNDVTYPELVIILRDIAKICNVIKQALEDNTLIVMETAQTGPCLDLSRLNLDLCVAMVKHNVDLILIEGMGRTLHTNFHVKMKCECLKLAIVKNQWLAYRFGGSMYAAICKYDQPPSKTSSYDIEMKPEAVKDDCPARHTGEATELNTCDYPNDRNTNEMSV
ncbi:PREDICTED: pantothenate kinase 4 isoform X2 [Vollenhovia emeryi]|uniref:pantothenate kinase 4 isoform X2 n=1 Tax=Vollenhovia emeryi TaxID=411798 RepID=UPI0005F481ED|nr:PREDICTED: pantothenate kinase 4 isoform X2 [Vollenhovia emeryi]